MTSRPVWHPDGAGDAAPWPSAAALAAAVGTALPATAWVGVTPETVRRFARLTGDDQPLHGGDDGVAAGKVVQGALLVSLATGLLHQVYRLPWARASYQAGYDRLRFRAPVLAGSRVRLHPTPRRFRTLPGTRYWLETEVRLEAAGEGEPALTGRFLSLIVGQP
jgi:acyl dehydratase